MHSEEDKLEFSKRLIVTLEAAGKEALSLSELATQFNLRHPNQSITAQTIHKWLTAQTIPTPDKIQTLSKWLGVAPPWLRYGKFTSSQPQLTQEEELLLSRFRLLTGEQQKALLVFLGSLMTQSYETGDNAAQETPIRPDTPKT